MFKSQQKEYELLKKDITDIKKYINDYVGYIIGTNGIAFALFAYLSLDESSSFDAKFITLFLGIVILFLLYSVVIYKFNSHNKLAGYIRLLTQEIDYIDLNKTNSVRVSSSVEYDGTFISWEFIMSKWDALISRKNCPKHSFNNLNFYFQPKETDLKIDKKTNNDEKRYSYFTNKENSVLIKKIQNKFLCKLVFENYPKLSNIFQVFFRKNKLYSKYKMSSWKYPKVIFLIFSTLYFFFLLTLIFLILLTHYKTLTNTRCAFREY